MFKSVRTPAQKLLMAVMLLMGAVLAVRTIWRCAALGWEVHMMAAGIEQVLCVAAQRVRWVYVIEPCDQLRIYMRDRCKSENIVMCR